jgi:glycosyltransferase involved in cell wall biosynthesis
MISVVCPYYNEEAIIEASITDMLANLSTLHEPWELIVVSDGSRDASAAIVARLALTEPRLRSVGYARNQGRGFALRTGIEHSKGDLVVTTEIDSSWGSDIVPRIVEVFREHPDADMVIASPHLHGGGYRNVPLKRVLLSTIGTLVIRAGLSYEITMNTGMTRGYRRDRILALPLEQKGKELHLEIVSKALAFGYRIVEIPATLEWKSHRGARARRSTSTAIPHTIRTHLFFSVLSAPFRYMFAASAVLLAGSLFFFGWAFYHLLTHQVAIFLAITGFFLGLFAFLVFAVGVLSNQNAAIQREIWKVQARLRQPGVPPAR